jgi:hypothetical protein
MWWGALADLAVFAAVAQQRSFVQAKRRLGLSTSSGCSKLPFTWKGWGKRWRRRLSNDWNRAVSCA